MISMANLCSFNGDKSVSCSWCIHSLLTDLNLLWNKGITMTSNIVISWRHKQNCLSSYRGAWVLLNFHNVSSAWSKNCSDKLFLNLKFCIIEISHLILKVANLNLSLNSWLYFSRRSRGRGRCRIVGGSADEPDYKTRSVSLFCSG